MTKDLLERLYYQQRLSMMEIAKQLGTTHATVLYWMKRHGLVRRSWSESTYIKLNPQGAPFSVIRELTPGQQELMHAALMLYWAEGSKEIWNIRIVNLDIRVLQLFCRFLREICRVDESRIFVYARVFREFPMDAAAAFWAEKLDLPRSRVFVHGHTDARSKRQHQWSPYGIATLEFHSTKLKRWLDEQIEIHIHHLLGGADIAEEPRGAYAASAASWFRIFRHPLPAHIVN